MFLNLFIVFSFLQLSQCLIHEFKITNDARARILMETFGFNANGEIHLDVYNFKIGDNEDVSDYENLIGFAVSTTKSNPSYVEDDSFTENWFCAEVITDWTMITGISDSNHTSVALLVPEYEVGFNNIYFVNCAEKPVSFELKLTLFNVDSKGNKNYLSAGDVPLPAMYAGLYAVYAFLLLAWNLRRDSPIQWVKNIFAEISFAALFFKSILFLQLQQYGTASTSYVVAVGFSAARKAALFGLIVVLGCGWTSLKPRLSKVDKAVVTTIFLLQVLGYFLFIISQFAYGVEKALPLFNLVSESISMVAVLILQTLNLRTQVRNNLEPFPTLRTFYWMEVTFFAWTGFCFPLLEAVLPFNLSWLPPLLVELATLLFVLGADRMFQ